MEPSSELEASLRAARARAESCATAWGLTLGPPFALATASFVAPAGDRLVLKVPSEGDDESLHEGDALELWGSDIAVRVVRRDGRALLEERAIPGTDLSALDDDAATTHAVELAGRLWRHADDPFRAVDSDVEWWLDRAGRVGSPLVGLARELHTALGGSAEWLVHGDFHHHNMLQDGARYIVIDPKPYLSDREYDVASFLWNPYTNTMTDRAQTERRVSAFVDAGLDDFRIRAWAVIRGAYLRPQFAESLRSLVA
ncbi:MAG TPA: aminoglycoside phosphotransferase family protein [Acidimicrobiales bacterium]|jgi:streptomycin 6-kinase|nr:aminoglycoside phosphotransferase family protein [Acidimicrobiales bacterium]